MKKLDRFIIGKRLGDGGAATVYLAEEQLPGGIVREVALKVFPALASGDKAGEMRLMREIRPLVALGGHPNIVTLLGAGITDSIPWIASEYAATTLAELLGEVPAAVEDVRRVIEQVAQGLSAMHRLEPPVLHNDLKPSNVLIVSGSFCKISDFGVACAVGEERTRAQTTARYAAPELLSREFGHVCPATDLYALGQIAYEMALGWKLHRAQFAGVFDERTGSREAHPSKWMAWHCSIGTGVAPVHELRKDFPRDLGEVIGRLMQKPLAARYASAQEVLTALKSGGQDEVSLEPAPALAGRFTPGARAGGGRFTFSSRAGSHPPPVPGAKPSPTRPTVAPAPVSAPAPSTKGPTMYWVRLRDKRSGPFDLATLKRQARSGLISRLHQVSTDQATWKPAGSVEGLFG